MLVTGGYWGFLRRKGALVSHGGLLGLTKAHQGCPCAREIVHGTACCEL